MHPLVAASHQVEELAPQPLAKEAATKPRWSKCASFHYHRDYENLRNLVLGAFTHQIIDILAKVKKAAWPLNLCQIYCPEQRQYLVTRLHRNQILFGLCFRLDDN